MLEALKELKAVELEFDSCNQIPYLHPSRERTHRKLLISAVRCVTETFPQLTILTTEIHPVAPNHFGQKYFGTD